jgi:hypothetical protein
MRAALSTAPGLTVQAGLGLFCQRAKRHLVKYRQISEHLAVDLDLGLVQAVNETAVG